MMRFYVRFELVDFSASVDAEDATEAVVKAKGILMDELDRGEVFVELIVELIAEDAE